MVSIVPYLRGHYSRDMLGRLWQLIENAGDWDKIFWGEYPGDDDLPISTRGDLVDWVQYIENPHSPTILLTGLVNDKIIGLMWFKKIAAIDTAHECGIWVKPEYRGKYTREFVYNCLKFIFSNYGWENIYGLTIHPIARNLAKKCGFTETKIGNIYYVECNRGTFNG